MDKRNRPIFKQRRPGAHHDRRRRYYGPDYERGVEEWLLLVPQEARVDRYELPRLMAAATALEADDASRGRRYLHRWRLDVDGRSWIVWAVAGSASGYHWDRGRLPFGVRDVLNGSEHRWTVYQGERRCSAGSRCPEASRFLADDGVSEVTVHRPGRCLLAVREPGVWKFAGTARKRGDEWYV